LAAAVLVLLQVLQMLLMGQIVLCFLKPQLAVGAAGHITIQQMGPAVVQAAAALMPDLEEQVLLGKVTLVETMREGVLLPVMARAVAAVQEPQVLLEQHLVAEMVVME
jgi:hypothetical protein